MHAEKCKLHKVLPNFSVCVIFDYWFHCPILAKQSSALSVQRLSTCGAHCCKEELLLPEISDSDQCFHLMAGRTAVPEQPVVPTLLVLCQVPVKPLQFLCCTLVFLESGGTGNGCCWDSSETAGVSCISLSGFLCFSAKVQFLSSHSWIENKNNNTAYVWVLIETDFGIIFIS